MEQNEVSVIAPDYFKVGSRLTPVYSNSFGSWINPEEGGSPQKALQFFDNNIEEKEVKSLEKGKMVHLYMQFPKKFAIAEVPKPSDMLGTFTDNLYRIISESLTIPETIDSLIRSDKKSSNGQAVEILEIEAAYDKLSASLNIPKLELIRIVRYARILGVDKPLYKTYSEPVLIGKFISEGLEYYKQKITLAGKIELTLADKKSIEGAIASLRLNSTACELLNLDNSIFSETIQEWKELDIYFLVNDIPCKARIDRLEIDHSTKTIKIVDGKTTSKSVYLFKNTCEYYRYYRQMAFYRKAVKTWIKDNPNIFDVLITKTGGVPISEYTIECYFIPVEMQDNFISTVYRVDEEYLSFGWTECISLLRRFQYHWSSCRWGKSMEEYQNNGILTLSRPV